MLSVELTDVWVVSAFQLLRILLQWTFVCKSLCGDIFSVFLDIGLEMELLDHMVTLFNVDRNCQTIFRSGRTISQSHPQALVHGYVGWNGFADADNLFELQAQFGSKSERNIQIALKDWI